MTDILNNNDIDFSKLKELILKSHEAESKKQVKLLDDKNSNRKKTKKINPKFCVEWTTLEKDFQVNRLIEFVDRFKEKEDLTEATSKKLRKLLVETLVHDKLDIDYDQSIGMINKIPKLQYNDIDGFFLGTYLNDKGDLPFRVSKISKMVNDDGLILTEDFTPTANTDSSIPSTTPSTTPTTTTTTTPSTTPTTTTTTTTTSTSSSTSSIVFKTKSSKISQTKEDESTDDIKISDLNKKKISLIRK